MDYSDYSLVVNSVVISWFRPTDQTEQSNNKREIPWEAGFFKAGNPETYEHD